MRWLNALLASTVLGRAMGIEVEVDASGKQKAKVELPSTKVASAWDPVYACEAIVVGRARFQVLTPQVVRMEYYEDEGGSFNDQATFVIVNRKVPCVEFTHTQTDEMVTIETSAVKLQYTGKGQAAFDADNLKGTLSFADGETLDWVPGQKNPGRLFGTIRTLDRVSGAHSLECDTLPERSRHPHSPVGQHCTYGLISRTGWTMVDDSKSPFFDGSDWPWVENPPDGTRQDWYLMAHGRDYKKALADFSMIGGRQPIPPRYSFGIFYSRWWPWADWESINIIKEYQDYAVPLDVLVTDMDWHKTCYREQDAGYVDLAGQPACWTGWTWDPKYFPDPKGFMDWCETHGIKNSLNLHLASGVQPWESQFREMAVAMGLDPDGQKVYVEWNVTDKKFSTNFHKYVLGPMEEQGIDLWWLDWQQGEGWFKDTFPGLTPTFFLNYVFFTQPTWANGKRPVLLHRWGGLGNHRYPVGFSGDTYPNWDSLAYQPYMTRESSNVLFGYWSHDIGGFMEPAEDELYLRWIQYGVFSPIFRTHGTRLAENIKRMWYNKPEYFKAMRKVMQMRAKMLPYIYTAARRAYDTGISICMPLYYDYPTLDEAYDFKTQYMFGPDMMIAPVVGPVDPNTQLLKGMEVWVPPGEWIEMMTGRVFKGPEVVTRSVALDEIPIYVRSGAVLINKLMGQDEDKPGQSGWLGRSEENPDGLEMNVYLPGTVSGKVEGSTLHYDDAGDSQAYLNGEYSWRDFSYSLNSGKMKVTIGAAQGVYTDQPEEQFYRIVVHGSVPPQKVTIVEDAIAGGGEDVPHRSWALFDPKLDANTWAYSGGEMALHVNLYKPASVKHDLIVEIDFGSGFAARRLKTVGVRGKIARAQTVKHTLDASYPETTPVDYDSVTHFAEIGVRMSYDPSTLAELLDDIPDMWKAAVKHGSQFKKSFRRKVSKNLHTIAKAHMNYI